jgi:hypothetical protein
MAGGVLLALASLCALGCDVSTGPASPDRPTRTAILIHLFSGNECPLAGFSSGRMTFRIDPAAADPVVALDPNGSQIRVWWPAGFRGGPSDDLVVRDAGGRIVARDGEVLTVPGAGFPNLHGYGVCSGGDGVGDAIWVQLHTP